MARYHRDTVRKCNGCIIVPTINRADSFFFLNLNCAGKKYFPVPTVVSKAPVLNLRKCFLNKYEKNQKHYKKVNSYLQTSKGFYTVTELLLIKNDRYQVTTVL
jgi:hypothetical protein